MTHEEEPPKSSGSPGAPEVFDKNVLEKPVQDEPRAADDTAHETDRPGFDLGRSSGNPHAGTGLGLGYDALDKPGERRLPGRRLYNKLTIPRWGGAEPRITHGSRKKLSVPKTSSSPQPEKES